MHANKKQRSRGASVGEDIFLTRGGGRGGKREGTDQTYPTCHGRGPAGLPLPSGIHFTPRKGKGRGKRGETIIAITSGLGGGREKVARKDHLGL